MPTGRRAFRPTVTGLVDGAIDVAGQRRTYSLAPAHPGAPLVVGLHGLGMTGRGLAAFTGLGVRGPAAGFATVFPDGLEQRWDDGRYLRARPDLDDIAFLRALLDRLVADSVARPGPVFLVGVSNGAFFAERAARQALLPISGLALVVGATAEHTREETPRPVRPTPLVCIGGTGDPLVPYFGGFPDPGRLIARQIRHRSGLDSDDPRRRVVPMETVAQDWAATNGLPPQPVVEQLANLPGDPPAQRLSWGAPGRPPVVLYRIEGGGHGWPGGPQYLPPRLIGPIPRHLDATQIVLDAARANLTP